jgi:hypothetical protein
MSEITLVIRKDGTVELEGHHYQGPACDADLRELAEALGTIESVEKKAEFFQMPQKETGKIILGGVQ